MSMVNIAYQHNVRGKMKFDIRMQKLRFIIAYSRLGEADKKRVYQILMRERNLTDRVEEVKPANQNDTRRTHTK